METGVLLEEDAGLLSVLSGSLMLTISYWRRFVSLLNWLQVSVCREYLARLGKRLVFSEVEWYYVRVLGHG